MLSEEQLAKIEEKNIENLIRKAAEGKPLTPTEISTLKTSTSAGADDLHSVHALALKTGLARQTVTRRLVGVKPFKQEGRKKFYRLRDISKILFGDLRQTATDGKGESKQALECKKLLKQIERLEIQVEKDKGLAIGRAEVRREWLHHCSQIRQALLALPDELAPALAGRSAIEIEKHVSGCVDRILETLKGSALADEIAEGENV